MVLPSARIRSTCSSEFVTGTLAGYEASLGIHMSSTVGSSRTQHVYRGEALRAVAMPLGGIGSGTIALCGDGSLRQWQIHNQVNHIASGPNSFFAVWARRASPPEEPVARGLASGALY